MSGNKFYDLIIVGGGAAGIMAAVSAKKNHPEMSIVLLDRSFALGRKILVAGAGRCNITNINLKTNPENHYYGAEKNFISSIFSQFSFDDIWNFFEELGVQLYVERKTDIGKVFPITDQAKTITTLLEDELQRLKIDVLLNSDVKEIIEMRSENSVTFSAEIDIIDQKSNKVLDHKTLNSTYLILSAGGKTYPALGSNGSGYTLAQSLGHTIIQPVPSALPLVCKNKLSQELQGVKMEIEATSIIDGKEVKTSIDDVMFTQYGLSGPAVLNISREISIQINRLKKNNTQVKLNFFPKMSAVQLEGFLRSRWEKRPDQTLEKSLLGLFHNKFPQALLKVININKDKSVNMLTESEVQLLVDKLTGYIIDVESTRGWNEAEFTAGGVDTSQVTEGTLESKLVKNLYLCGEVLDVDGDVGGYNLSWAWSSGYVAGKLK